MIELLIQRVCKAPGIPADAKLRTWVEAALKGHRQHAEITLRLADSRESQQLNLCYRHKDQPTNVLAFPADYDLPVGVSAQLRAELENKLGDLVICVPLVAVEAEQQGKPLEQHWAHLVIHGCLHLLGFDHLNDKQAEAMETLEIKILATLGIPNPYQ